MAPDVRHPNTCVLLRPIWQKGRPADRRTVRQRDTHRQTGGPEEHNKNKEHEELELVCEQSSAKYKHIVVVFS